MKNYFKIFLELKLCRKMRNICHKNEGDSQDYQEALKWFQKAAENGQAAKSMPTWRDMKSSD